jgi:anti-anti-sigma factor
MQTIDTERHGLEVHPGPDGVLMVVGDLDMAQAIRFSAEVVSKLGDRDEVILDLSGVTFLDSWGVRAMFQLPTTARVTVVLRHAQGNVAQLLDIASLDAPVGVRIQRPGPTARPRPSTSPRATTAPADPRAGALTS